MKKNTEMSRKDTLLKVDGKVVSLAVEISGGKMLKGKTRLLKVSFDFTNVSFEQMMLWSVKNRVLAMQNILRNSVRDEVLANNAADDGSVTLDMDPANIAASLEKALGIELARGAIASTKQGIRNLEKALETLIAGPNFKGTPETIRALQEQLKAMQGTLEKASDAPADSDE